MTTMTESGRNALRNKGNGIYSFVGTEKEIDGYWCFVGNERGKEVIYEKTPMTEYNSKMEQAYSFWDIYNDFMQRETIRIAVENKWIKIADN